MKCRAKRTILLGVVSSLPIVAATEPVFAQGEPSSAHASTISHSESIGSLEDIVVTARKRAESIQDVPIAITAYSAERLDRADVTSIEKVAALTPQFQVGKAATGSGAQMTLRGIGSNSSSIGIEQSVAVIVDGVYSGNGRIINESFFDLERVELMKGPQALFFGKNATAGSISITTANPTDRFEGRTRVGYEFNAQQVIGEQILSGPLSPDLGGRLAIRMSKMFGGYTTNFAEAKAYNTRDVVTGVLSPHIAPPAPRTSPKELDFVGRATLKWAADDGLDFTLKSSYAYMKNNDPSWNNIVFSCPGGFSQLQPTVPCKRDWYAYHNNIPSDIADVYYPNAKNFGATYRNASFTGLIDYVTDLITVNSVTNFQSARSTFVGDSDYQRAPVNELFVSDVSKYRSFSSEIRVTSTLDGPFNFMFGALYQTMRRSTLQGVSTGNVEDASRPAWQRYATNIKTGSTEGTTVSPFAQVTINPVPTVELAAGARYTYEKKDSEFYHVSALTPNYRVYPDVASAHQKFTDLSPEVTLTWKPSPNFTIYGAYKTAYKSGGFSNAASYVVTSQMSDFAFGPESAEGFEAGIKGVLFDKQLRFDITAFTFKYDDLQVDFFNGPTIQYITTNAGSARTKGLEFQADYAPRGIDGLILRASLNYTDAAYVEFLAPCYTGQRPAAGCNTIAFRGPGQNLAGVETANAPNWTGALGVAFDRELANGKRLGVSLDGRYSGSYIGSAFGNPQSRQPEYVAIDASLRFGDADGSWEVALVGKNLTNQFWISGALDGPSTGSGTGTVNGRISDQRGFANVPRTVQLQFTTRY